jgi:hypothetical protein
MSDESLEPIAKWVATLSDGTTAVEHTGSFMLEEGKRKPWPRLTDYLAQNDLYLTSLRLNFLGRTIHLPRENFDKFNTGEINRPPLSYSLCYHIEAEAEYGSLALEETRFIELTAHYEDFAVSYVQDITGRLNSWVFVTEARDGLAETPRRMIQEAE